MFRSTYLDRNTVIHRLDPRTKIGSLLGLSAILFVFNNPLYVVQIALGLVALGALAQSLENYYRLRYLLIVFLIVPFVVWQFYLRGATVIAQVGPLTLTREAILYGIAAGIRLSSTLMLGTLFISTTTVEELMVGLIRMRVPYPVALVFALTTRLIPTFAAAAATIIQAQVARGLDLETRNPLQRARRLVPVIIPFLVYTIRYASLLAMALEAKGFRSDAKRTSYLDLTMRQRDYLIVAALLTLAVVFLLLRINGYGVVVPGRL